VFSPKKLTVPVNSTITWKWASANSDTHDVYLSKRPKGVKRFHSDPASSDFSYKRKLSKKGTYSVLCTFHENMTQKITVR
jgi:plastocyanin